MADRERLAHAVLALTGDPKELQAALEETAKSLAGLTENFRATGTKLDAVAAGMSKAGKEASTSAQMIKGMSEVGRAEMQRLADAAEKPARSLEEIAKSAGKGMQDFGRGAQNVGQMFLPISAAVAALGIGSAKAAIDFESSFAGIRKTVGDATDSLGNLTVVGQQLSDGMRAMSKEIPINVNELNKIGEAAGQLGIKSENILGFTRVMANLGVTTNLSSEEAATALARLANITQMPQQDFDRLGSTIVALGNNMATTEADITNFGLRIAGAGKQVGLSEAQVLSIGAALSSVGLEAEAGGTAISKVMIDMASAVQGGGERLSQFAGVAGKSSAQFKKQFETDAAGALIAFITGLGNMEAKGKSTLGVLEDMGIKEVRLRDALLRASGAGDLLAKSIDIGTDAWKANNALTAEAEQRYRTTSSQLTLLWNNVKDVAITLGEALLPILRSAVETLRGWIPMIEGAAKWFSQLSPEVKTTVVVIGGLVAALGPALMAFGIMVTTIGAALPVLATVGSALLAFATGPIGIAVAAVVGLAFVWVKWGDDITRIVTQTYTAVKTWLLDKFTAIVDGIRSKIDAVKGFFAGMYDAVVGHSYVPDMVKQIGREFAAIDKLMVQPSKKATTETKEAFRELNKAIEQFSGKDVIEKALQYVAVVQQLGGVSKLTKAEQDQVNVALSAAIEKYEALGRQVPPALAAIASQLGLTTQVTEKLKKTFEDLHLATVRAAAAMRDDYAKQAEEQTKIAERTGTAILAQVQRVVDAEAQAALAARAREFQTAEHAIAQATRAGASKEQLAYLEGELSRARADAAIADADREFQRKATLIDQTTVVGKREYAALAEAHRLNVERISADFEHGEAQRRAGLIATRETWMDSLDAMGEAFAQLGQIGGNVLGGITRGIGTMIGSIKAATTSWSSLSGGFKSLTSGQGFSSVMSGISGIVGGIGGIVAAASAAVAAIKAISGAFQSEETKKVNKPRDQFFLQFGPSGTGAGSGFHNLAALLTSLGAGDGGGALFRALAEADTQAKWNNAQAAVAQFLKDNGRDVETFGTGGVVSSPMRAIVGDVPEAIIPLDRLDAMLARERGTDQGSAVATSLSAFKSDMLRLFRSELPMLVEIGARHGAQTAGRRL